MFRRGEESGMDYAEAGVDIDDEAAFVEALTSGLSGVRTGLGEPLEAPGGYAGLVSLGDHVMALSMDGVGTKLLVAEALGDFSTVGIDCVAMNANDVVCTGVEPVSFLDYVAVESHDAATAEQLGRGLQEGCERANVELVAGETATLPEMVHGLDLVGTCVGYGDRDDLAPGESEPGDHLVGLASSGIHSNGLTLARKAAEEAGGFDAELPDGTPVGEALLTPTKMYVEATLECLRTGAAKAAAHVTGGGFLNLERLGPNAYRVTSPQNTPPVFDFVRKAADVSATEMYRTFNMGTGMVLATDAPDDAVAVAEGHGHEAEVIGRVREGDGVAVKGIGEL